MDWTLGSTFSKSGRGQIKIGDWWIMVQPNLGPKMVEVKSIVKRFSKEFNINIVKKIMPSSIGDTLMHNNFVML